MPIRPRSTDGSTFALTTFDDTTPVATEGPLWDMLESAYTQWGELGQPTRERFGLTAAEERQWVWLDHPDQVITELGAK
jgi:hypothetical protein